MQQFIQIFHKYKDRDFIFIIPFALLSLDVRLRYFFYLLHSGKGFPQSDDTQWYIDYAQSLIANFKIGLHMNDILYIGYNLLLAMLLAIFKDTTSVIFIQAVATGLGVIFVFKISRMLFNKTTAIIASYFYYEYSWSLTLWSTYILSDSFFISFLLLNVYLLLKFMESRKNVYKILFILTSLYILVFRPTGVVSLFFILIYILINIDKNMIKHFVIKHRLAIGGTITAALSAGIYLYVSNMCEPFMNSMQFNAKMVLYNIYAKGWIYDRPSPYDYFFKPDYDIDIMNSLVLSFLINNWDNVAILYGKRVIAFIGKWAWDTRVTGVRTFIKFALNALPAFLFLAGTAAAIRNGIFRKTSIVWLIILAVFIFCVFLFIDGMYRYKAPCIPFIMIAAAYGADSILREAWSISKKLYAKLLSRAGKKPDLSSGV